MNYAKLLVAVVFATTLSMLPLFAQEKSTEQQGEPKPSTADGLSQEPAPKPGERLTITPLPEKQTSRPEKRSSLTSLTPGQPRAYWFIPNGGFHMDGPTGRSIFYLRTTTRSNWDLNWKFTDGLPVGNRAGWTYSADGYGFWMFFSKYWTADCGGTQYQLMYSYNNEDFYHFACTSH